MIAAFERSDNSKEIYFSLSNSLQLANPLRSNTYKIAGLYAIYSDELCLYVGQSKNIPSRLSTHLTGRYKSAHRIEVYFICEDSFEDFYTRTKLSQKLILENNENHLINLLEPVENIVVDRDIVRDDLLFESFIDSDYSAPSAIIIMSRLYFTVCDDPYHCMDEVDKYIVDSYTEMLAATGRLNRDGTI